mmetsp:Transcript_2037/g.6019  ORF Transcript_2037/g.6019 Transcript_2037/m.6019 type:complete len:261 (-) Transcript_2037:143-925(-)
MAPEMFNGSQMDEKVDIYALGLILCECLTGETPWGDYDNFAQIVLAVAIQEERPEIPESVPMPMRRLITKCWQDEPFRRPSAPEVARLLQYMLKMEDAAVASADAEPSAIDLQGEVEDLLASQESDSNTPNLSVRQVDRAEAVMKAVEQRLDLAGAEQTEDPAAAPRIGDDVRELLEKCAVIQEKGDRWPVMRGSKSHKEGRLMAGRGSGKAPQTAAMYRSSQSQGGRSDHVVDSASSVAKEEEGAEVNTVWAALRKPKF